MKKREMTKIALLGLSSGLLLAGQVNAVEAGVNQSSPILLSGGCQSHGCGGVTADRNTSSTNTSTSTTDTSDADFRNQLDAKTRALYDSLSDEGKALARKLAKESAFSDKSTAVRDAARQMSQKNGSTTK